MAQGPGTQPLLVMGRCGARDGARPRFTVGDGGGARSVTDRPVPRDGQFLLRRQEFTKTRGQRGRQDGNPRGRYGDWLGLAPGLAARSVRGVDIRGPRGAVSTTRWGLDAVDGL